MLAVSSALSFGGWHVSWMQCCPSSELCGKRVTLFLLFLIITDMCVNFYYFGQLIRHIEDDVLDKYGEVNFGFDCVLFPQLFVIVTIFAQNFKIFSYKVRHLLFTELALIIIYFDIYAVIMFRINSFEGTLLECAPKAPNGICC